MPAALHVWPMSLLRACRPDVPGVLAACVSCVALTTHARLLTSQVHLVPAETVATEAAEVGVLC